MDQTLQGLLSEVRELGLVPPLMNLVLVCFPSGKCLLNNTDVGWNHPVRLIGFLAIYKAPEKFKHRKECLPTSGVLPQVATRLLCVKTSPNLQVKMNFPT
jgi:hypothetical protein